MKDLKIKIAYNGKLDNMDNMRPELNMHCTLTENGKQLYKLENILVNGGRYDTYVVRNLKTNKLKRVCKIYRVLKSRPAFTKKEVWELIERQNTKPAAAFPVINRLYFRFECFGDLMNALQARNYLKLVLKNPRCTFTQWTKKPWILNHVFKTENKPDNMIVILSAPRVNDTLTIDQARAAWPFVDKIFTVYSKEYLLNHDVVINCGARYCLGCLNCYGLENTPDEIKEVLK